MTSGLGVFVKEHRADDVNRLALQRNRYPELSDTEFRFALQQIEGRQRMADKLPQLSQIEDWWYPIRLSLEQCSSEATALYKVSVLQQALQGRTGKLIDLTGGFGIDCYYLSQLFEETLYVERNEELCIIAEHNFRLTNRNIKVQHGEAGLLTKRGNLFAQQQSTDYQSIIFIDPARRSSSGGKVFKLEDCVPNVLEMLPVLRAKTGIVLLKLSPMLDLAEIMRQLHPQDVHVVAVNNEVKEALALINNTDGATHITAVNIDREGQHLFKFDPEEEIRARATIVEELNEVSTGSIVYEPGAAILKTGAFKLISQKYGMRKLSINTHLYTCDEIRSDLYGRYFRILGHMSEKTIKASGVTRASVLCRNYPMQADVLKKKLGVKDDDKQFIIGCTIGKKATLLLAERI